MGIHGVLIGTPDDLWILVAVGTYAPSDFSSSGRLKTLFSASEFWGTVLIFPLAMIAMSMLTTRLRQEWPLGVGFLLVSLGSVAVAIIFSGLWLISLAFSTTNGDDFVFIFAVLSAIPLAVATGCAWQMRWLKRWRAIMGSLLSMMVIVTLSFIAWLQIGGPPGFALVPVILLCAATSWALGRLLMREELPWAVTWSRR